MLQGYPTFATLDDWLHHMMGHSQRWHREIYNSNPWWVCAICDDRNDVFSSPDTLSTHTREVHSPELTTDQLDAISRVSKTLLPRPRDGCPLCGYRVAGNSFQTQQIRPSPHGCAKRTQKPASEKNSKSARTSFENRHAVPHSSINNFSSSSAEDEGPELLTAPTHTEMGDMVARHVAAHFQALMLLTIRLASIQVEDKDTLEDVRSDLCDTEGLLSALLFHWSRDFLN
ncbi:hypothetical protein BDV30DRAFT_234081 [Aspergillus minisclerotigenes]|uniref:C2H2-type domain-containing protein n=1 Tax=Aspergillus minisclerotigenes TaxID=656917 RepID=A0A5N6JJN2_9EURO|nr:hypothetical protein BDV30DRAFT_234081 [Aspergillus minisclerotigenes]